MITRVNSAIVRNTNTMQVTIHMSNRVVYDIGGVTVAKEAKLDDNVSKVVIPIITRPVKNIYYENLTFYKA